MYQLKVLRKWNMLCNNSHYTILAALRRSVQRVAGPISAPLRQDNTAPKKHGSSDDTVTDLTDPGFAMS